MGPPVEDGEAEEEGDVTVVVMVAVAVVAGRSEVKKLKQQRRKMRRKKTRIWIHISHGILYPSIVSSSPKSNMGCSINLKRNRKFGG